MPWRTKKRFILILLGCLAVILGSIVGITSLNDAKVDLLAWIGVIGGIAIILNSLPDKEDE